MLYCLWFIGDVRTQPVSFKRADNENLGNNGLGRNLGEAADWLQGIFEPLMDTNRDNLNRRPPRVVNVAQASRLWLKRPGAGKMPVLQSGRGCEKGTDSTTYLH